MCRAFIAKEGFSWSFKNHFKSLQELVLSHPRPILLKFPIHQFVCRAFAEICFAKCAMQRIQRDATKDSNNKRHMMVQSNSKSHPRRCWKVNCSVDSTVGDSEKKETVWP